MRDEPTARFIGGTAERPLCWRQLMTMIGAWHATGVSMFSVVEKTSGRWLGRLGPWMPDGWPGPEVGWALVRDCWGRGYATEGSAAAIDWAFDHLGWDRVIHSISPDNVASQAVARKLGGWNIDLLASDPFIEAERARECGVTLVDFETLCRRSHFVMLHLPLLPEPSWRIPAWSYCRAASQRFRPRSHRR